MTGTRRTSCNPCCAGATCPGNAEGEKPSSTLPHRALRHAGQHLLMRISAPVVNAPHPRRDVSVVFVATFSNQSADSAACRASWPHPANGRNLLRIYHVVAAPLVDERSRSAGRDVRIREVEVVVTIRSKWSVVGVLAAISLASTDLVLILQAYFGYRPALVLLGPLAAAAGATVYTVWLSNRV